MKKTALLALAAILFAACAKEAAPETTEKPTVDPKEGLAPGTLVLKAGFEAPVVTGAPATKVNVSDAGSLSWKTGDEIAVWTSNGESGKFCTFSLYTGNGEQTATFTGTPDDGYSVSTLAVYPASAAKSYEGGTLTVSYPDSYEYGDGTANVRMAAYFSDVEDGLTFKHLGGLIRFSISNIPSDVNCFRLTSDKPLSGDFAVTSAKEVVSSVAGADEVEISFEAGSVTDRQFAIPVPVGSYNLTAGLYAKEGDNYTLCNKSVRTTSKEIARKDYVQMKSYSVVAGGTYYVKTTESGDKDGSSWDNAASLENALFWAEDGETIKMAAGTYTASAIPELYSDAGLTTPVTAAEWKVFVITSNVTIEGGYAGSSETESPNYASNVTTIDGTSGAAHGFAVAAPKATGKKVSVKGIKITNFTSPSTNNAARTKDNIYLAGSYGSAIVARGTEVEFDQCTITGNTATVGGKCTVYGAGDGAAITFKDCTISGNTADNGAVANAHGSTVSFTGTTTITGNTAAANLFQTDATGIVVITGGTSVTGNEAVNVFNNTASGGQTTISGNAVVSNNTATAVVANAGTFNMSGSATVSGHTGITNAIANAGTVEISEGAKIINNTASSYLVDNSATFNVSANAGADSVRFSGNETLAVLRLSAGTMALTGKIAIAGNTALKVIRNENAEFSMSGGNIYGNTSSESAGVIFNRGISSFTNTKISRNTGTWGLLYNYSSASCSLSFTTCNIHRNVATANNGGLIYNNTAGVLTISGGTVSSNTSPLAIIHNLGTATLNGGCVLNNNYVNLAAAGTAGGVLYQPGASTNLSLDGVTVSGSNRSDNTKYAGGVLFANDGNVTIGNSHIKNNTSHRSQGTVLQANGNGKTLKVKIYNSEVSGNTGDGGQYVLYFRTCTAAEIVNSTITNNTVTGSYGGIALYGDSSSPKNAVKLISCTVVGNTAAAISGVYMNNANNNTYLYNTVVSGNIRTSGSGQADYYGASGALVYRTNSIITGTLYDENRTAVSGVTFDPSTMIGPLQSSGVVPMIGTGNPAKGSYGMTQASLQGLNPATTEVSADILGADQLGNSRSGKTCIGAYAGE